jgi:hypothetical protein
MLTELKSIFESVDKEILSEDTLKAISSLIEEKVNAKAEERIELEVENAVKAQYAKFKTVSEKAIASIDADHTNKIKMVVNAIMEDYDQKLLTVHEGYKNVIANTAIKHRDTLVESVDEFLDLYIEKNIPKQEIEEAARNQYALKAIEEARKILGVDEKYMQNNFKEALVDGKRQMDTLLKENEELRKAKLISENKKVLAEKTANLPVEVARFVRSRLEGKSTRFIQENFEYVMDMYGRQEQKAKQSALLSEKKTYIVDRNRVADEFIKESENKTINQSNPQNPMEDLYLSGLNFRK